MAKRFTDTDKWKKPFVRGLSAQYKLLWFYLLDDCDHAGIWLVDLEVASLRCGFDFNEKDVLKHLGVNVEVINNTTWFIRDFVSFQYGELNPLNRAHNSVISRLKNYGIKPLTSPLQGAMDKDKEQEKDKDKEKGVAKNSIPSTDRIPDLETFIAFGLEKASANRLNVTRTALSMKYEAWKEAGWVNGNGQEVKNWKASLINTLPHIKSEPVKDDQKFVPRKPYFPEQP